MLFNLSESNPKHIFPSMGFWNRGSWKGAPSSWSWREIKSSDVFSVMKSDWQLVFPSNGVPAPRLASQWKGAFNSWSLREIKSSDIFSVVKSDWHI
jgi:hypothetical protein